MSNKKKILLFADWYEPGFRAGGPIRSCVNFVKHMQEDYEIFIFTRDRDLGATRPYAGLATDHWIGAAGGPKSFYASPAKLGWEEINNQIKKISPDFIYLNSMYSRYFSIYPLLLQWLGMTDATTILCPRGMLRDSAVRFKSSKKKFFLFLLRILGLARRIRFQATDEQERRDIRKYFGEKADISILAHFPVMHDRQPEPQPKDAGALRLIFVGRIHPIKNLQFLLQALAGQKGNIELRIIGNLEDEHYWHTCESIITSLPPNIRVQYLGEMPAGEVEQEMKWAHALALPTLGENFGHAIVEAFALGKPVIISDQTPWRNLAAKGAGWDLPLDQPRLFAARIEELAGMGKEEYENLSRNAWEFAEEYFRTQNLRAGYQKLFS